ncbi:hypothetical protein [Gymnodinialimonas hymeniacidonis]|uniref:hypothetical protein n=1 Tax=Gymnodinialimonas hymeniacidonis TaxID=3126508 RepID=UPI0034C6C59E
MGAAYGIVGYPDVPRGEAAGALAACEAALREDGWIEGDHDPDAVYGDRGPTFRPAADGPAGRLLFMTHPVSGARMEMAINGVSFCGPSYLNHGPFIDMPSFECPSCGGETRRETDGARAQQERCFEMFGRYADADDALRQVACVHCQAEVDINDLIADGPPTFVLSDVAVEFWDWPPDLIEPAAALMDRALGRPHRMGWVHV